MSTNVIPFPASRNTAAAEPNPFEFWINLLNDTPAPEREHIIREAYRCAVIDEKDLDILLSSWLDQEGG